MSSLAYLKLGLFYGSTTGRTEDVAELIRENFPWIITEAIDIAHVKLDTLASHDVLILGTSTWDIGKLQRDWDGVFEDLASVDFSGVRVAFFGLGDQVGYPGNFQDAMGILRDRIVELGGRCDIGFWPTDGYDFERSAAVRDGRFVGLGLDDDNQDHLTEKRVDAWCLQLRQELEADPE